LEHPALFINLLSANVVRGRHDADVACRGFLNLVQHAQYNPSDVRCRETGSSLDKYYPIGQKRQKKQFVRVRFY